MTTPSKGERRNWLLEDSNKVSASVFSCDDILHKDTLKKFKVYVERRGRKIEELEKAPETLRGAWE